MKRFLIFLVTISLWGQGQGDQTVSLNTDPPAAVNIVSASITGNQGSNTFYYHVVARYPIGNASMRSTQLINAPNPTVSNYVTVSWSPASGATGYDILKTTVAGPVSSCTCLLVSNTSANSVQDTGQSLTSYTVSVAPQANGTIAINNRDYSTPRLIIPAFPLMGFTELVFPDGTTQSTAGGGGSVSITASSPIVITPSPTTGTGVISCPTCSTGGNVGVGATGNLPWYAAPGSNLTANPNINTDINGDLLAGGSVASNGATLDPACVSPCSQIGNNGHANGFNSPSPTSTLFLNFPNANPTLNSFMLFPVLPASNSVTFQYGTFGTGLTVSGGVVSVNFTAPANTPAVTNEWLNSYNSTTGAFTQTQPAFSNLSGSATTGQLPTNQIIRERKFFFSGGGSALTAQSACTRQTFAGTITEFGMEGDQSGNATVKIQTVLVSSYTGLGSTSDISSGGESMTGAVVKTDTTLSGWTAAVAAETEICAVLSSPATITQLAVTLKMNAN